MKTLRDYMRESTTDPFLMLGPPAPKAGWVYRDFRAMPQALWLTLIEILGIDQITMVSANSKQLPPAQMCRAQMWISPQAQTAWKHYLRRQQ